MSQARIEREIHMSLDGLVFTMPPSEATARENYYKTDMTRVWRTRSERNLPELQGCDRYARQVPFVLLTWLTFLQAGLCLERQRTGNASRG